VRFLGSTDNPELGIRFRQAIKDFQNAEDLMHDISRESEAWSSLPENLYQAACNCMAAYNIFVNYQIDEITRIRNEFPGAAISRLVGPELHPSINPTSYAIANFYAERALDHAYYAYVLLSQLNTRFDLSATDKDLHTKLMSLLREVTDIFGSPEAAGAYKPSVDLPELLKPFRASENDSAMHGNIVGDNGIRVDEVRLLASAAAGAGASATGFEPVSVFAPASAEELKREMPVLKPIALPTDASPTSCRAASTPGSRDSRETRPFEAVAVDGAGGRDARFSGSSAISGLWSICYPSY
jgi:hypothetical protein